MRDYITVSTGGTDTGGTPAGGFIYIHLGQRIGEAITFDEAEVRIQASNNKDTTILCVDMDNDKFIDIVTLTEGAL